MRAKLLFGGLALFGVAAVAQAGPQGASVYLAPATGLPVGAFAREEALTVYPSTVTVLRGAAPNASSVDPGLYTRTPFTTGRTRPMFSESDSLVRPRGVAGPKIYQPAVSTPVTVAR